jgi:hydrogenase large subunit
VSQSAASALFYRPRLRLQRGLARSLTWPHVLTTSVQSSSWGLLLDWIGQIAADQTALAAYPAAPSSGQGYGLTEAPRGALGHWITIESGVVSRYQVVSPTTWNGSPRDEADQPGPIESALAGIAMADPADPVEVNRVIHSFDPCVQCAVH